MNIQSFLSFLGIFLHSPKDEAGLKLAGDISAVVQDWIKDPRLPQIEADVEAYLKLAGEGSAQQPAAPPAEVPDPDVDAGGRPSGSNRGGLMPPGV